MHQNSPFRKKCKTKLHQNAWIVSIHQEESITIDRFLECVKYLCKNDVLTVQLTLVKKITSTYTKYQEFRSQFDSFRSIVAKASVNIFPTVKYAVQLPTKPPAPKDW